MDKEKKEKRHYKTRSSFVVVSVNPDGTVDAVYNSAADAAKAITLFVIFIRIFSPSKKIIIRLKYAMIILAYKPKKCNHFS
jgi:hypothetical protein